MVEYYEDKLKLEFYMFNQSINRSLQWLNDQLDQSIEEPSLTSVNCPSKSSFLLVLSDKIIALSKHGSRSNDITRL
jgi:hypothetical protein